MNVTHIAQYRKLERERLDASGEKIAGNSAKYRTEDQDISRLGRK
jgi:hypothetical protein